MNFYLECGTCYKTIIVNKSTKIINCPECGIKYTVDWKPVLNPVKEAVR